jgi:hypothetical protein
MLSMDGLLNSVLLPNTSMSNLELVLSSHFGYHTPPVTIISEKHGVLNTAVHLNRDCLSQIL